MPEQTRDKLTAEFRRYPKESLAKALAETCDSAVIGPLMRRSVRMLAAAECIRDLQRVRPRIEALRPRVERLKQPGGPTKAARTKRAGLVRAWNASVSRANGSWRTLQRLCGLDDVGQAVRETMGEVGLRIKADPQGEDG